MVSKILKVFSSLNSSMISKQIVFHVSGTLSNVYIALLLETKCARKFEEGHLRWCVLFIYFLFGLKWS